MAENTTGMIFLEHTKYQNLNPSDQMLGVKQPALEIPSDKDVQVIDLPDPNNLEVPEMSLRAAIEERRSIRTYTDKALSLEALSYLLWCTQGVKGVVHPQVTLRTVPSAGARHALETYILSNHVSGLKTGLYRFMAIDHQLAPIDLSDDVGPKIVKACLNQNMVTRCAVTFIWTAVPYRMTWRYGERGFRYLFLDAGHVCQNLYLSAESVHCGVCAIAAFNDDAMNRCVHVDGEKQFVIYIATLGRRKKALIL
jgi:SagB-type dehydrogenase family enzyme